MSNVNELKEYRDKLRNELIAKEKERLESLGKSAGKGSKKSKWQISADGSSKEKVVLIRRAKEEEQFSFIVTIDLETSEIEANSHIIRLQARYRKNWLYFLENVMDNRVSLIEELNR